LRYGFVLVIYFGYSGAISTPIAHGKIKSKNNPVKRLVILLRFSSDWFFKLPPVPVRRRTCGHIRQQNKRTAI